MGSDKHWKRIEEMLETLSAQQTEICRRLERLERGSAPAGAAGDRPNGTEVLEFLDQFRAGEALGEASVGAWIEATRDDALRGALRTVQMREGMHARLLEARIKELGGSPEAEVPEAVFEASMERSASTDISDADKLAAFMAQFPDTDAALAPLVEMADRLDHDGETQALLRTICQDERATLECLAQACAERSAD